MARSRNWPAATYAEVFVRLDHGQKVAHVARAAGLTYQQVDYFAEQLKLHPGDAPPNGNMPTADEVNEWHAKIEAEIASETKPSFLPEDLEAELVGCIDLVRQAAEPFGLTPRQFLHRCLTHARSVG